MSEEEGTTVCPFSLKNERNVSLNRWESHIG